MNPTHQQRIVLALALSATAISLVLSATVAWLRGTSWVDRGSGIALGTLVVLSTHLLPAITARLPLQRRWAFLALWLACSSFTLYFHATFALQAQAWAAEVRIDALPPSPATMPAGPVPKRSLAEVAAEEAEVEQQLARLTAQRCVEHCHSLDLRRTVLTTRSKALAEEGGDIRRWQSAQDRLAGLSDRARDLRDAARQEPVLGRLAAVLDLSVSTLELLLALLVAVVLEGLACMLWQLWMREQVPLLLTGSGPTQEPSSLMVVTEDHLAPGAAAMEELDPDLMRVSTAVAEGALRPTVANIRAFLGCAQAKASQVRQRLQALESTPSAGPR